MKIMGLMISNGLVSLSVPVLKKEITLKKRLAGVAARSNQEDEYLKKYMALIQEDKQREKNSKNIKSESSKN